VPSPSHSRFADDDAFDDCLPITMRFKASIHFTPVEVARQAAHLLAPVGGMAVLDVGAGPGKFCLVAAHAIPGASFTGVELRPHLVAFAIQAARECRLANARFIAGDALDLDWSPYDAFYLYNPFAEQLFSHGLMLDRTIAVDPANFAVYVAAVRERLSRARLGTRVVTYHGYGGTPPAGYELATVLPMASDRLELWIKVRAVTEAELAAQRDEAPVP
jgi:SAM-dependent methyltransferase